MADEIKQRLQDCSENCVKSYEAWRKDDKNIKAREALQESIHEIRKVASRLEIELAVSERDQMAQKPIPIPPHRNSRNKPKDQGDGQSKKPSKKNESKGEEKKEASASVKASLANNKKKAARGGGEEE